MALPPPVFLLQPDRQYPGPGAYPPRIRSPAPGRLQSARCGGTAPRLAGVAPGRNSDACAYLRQV